MVRSFGGWTSINYFVFFGMTDSVEEYEALQTDKRNGFVYDTMAQFQYRPLTGTWVKLV